MLAVAFLLAASCASFGSNDEPPQDGGTAATPPPPPPGAPPADASPILDGGSILDAPTESGGPKNCAYLCDGFESGMPSATWKGVSGSVNPTVVTGSPTHAGTHALSVSLTAAQTAGRLYYQRSDPGSPFAVAAWIRIPGVNTNDEVDLLTLSSASASVNLRASAPGGQVKLWLAMAGQQSSPIAVTAAGYFCVELSVSAGLAVIKVSGTPNSLPFSGSLDRASVGPSRASATTAFGVFYDDVIVTTATGNCP